MVGRAVSGRKALSGIVAALLISFILIAGITTVAYINRRSSQLFQRAAEEALAEARLRQELIRIYIHSEDGTIDKPAYITFVNGWGFNSKILKILVISKNYTVMSEIDLNPPLEIGPGRHVRISPSTLGLNYPTFRAFADNIAALIAYTEAGNRFGSTWGFPRDDNLVGATTVTTYNITTTYVFYVPPFTTVNQTVTINPITTLNPSAPVTHATVYARAHFERINILTAPNLNGDQDPGYSSTVNDQIVQGAPAHPDPDWRNVISVLRGQLYNPPRFLPTNDYYDYGLGYRLWFWAPTGDFYTVTGNPTIVEGNTYYAFYNAPRRYTVTVSGSTGACTVVYSLARVDISPLPRDGFNPTPQGYITRIAMVGTFTHDPVPTGSYVTTRTIGQWPRETVTQYTVTLYMSRVGPEPTFTAANTVTAQLMNKDPYNWNHPTAVKTGNREIWMTLTVPAGTATYTGGWTYWRAVAWPTAISTLTLNNVRVAYVLLGNADAYVVDRYYYVDRVSCYVYQSPPPPPRGTVHNPGPLPPPPTCPLYVVVEQSKSSNTEGGGGQGPQTIGEVWVRFRLECR